jgi:hypothetical protein
MNTYVRACIRLHIRIDYEFERIFFSKLIRCYEVYIQQKSFVLSVLYFLYIKVTIHYFIFIE